MSLLADIKASGHTKGERCSVALLLEAMTEADRAELVEVLQGSHASTDIARALRKRGVYISHAVLSRHRRGDCACR